MSLCVTRIMTSFQSVGHELTHANQYNIQYPLNSSTINSPFEWALTEVRLVRQVQHRMSTSPIFIRYLWKYETFMRYILFEGETMFESF